MRSLGIAILLGIFVFPALGQAAPFGLTQGMTLKELGGKPESLGDRKYRFESVPKPHSAFEFYVLQIGQKSGLCFVKAVGKNVKTSVYGSELRFAFQAMQDRLSSVYGSPDNEFDDLSKGSIWDEPKDWMMSLLKKERFVASGWEMKKRAENADLQLVLLGASALSTEEGYISVEYYLSNHDECEKEIANSENDAL
jgi:hypothetical protein